MGMSMSALTNRLNSLKSTGPKSPEGKLKAARNAIKHGILAADDVVTTESVRFYNRMKARLTAELEPEGEVEILLASRIVSLVWRLRRVVRMEVEMMEHQLDRRAERLAGIMGGLDGEAITLGSLFALECSWSDPYSKFRRYEAHIDRLLFRALHELERRQMARKGEAVAAPAVVEVNVHSEQDAA